MKTIARFIKQHDAYLLKIQLEISNIPVLILDDISTSVTPQYTLAYGGIRVQVPDEYVEQAEKILRENQIHANIKNRFTCPDCGSGNIKESFNRTTVHQKKTSMPFMQLQMETIVVNKGRW